MKRCWIPRWLVALVVVAIPLSAAIYLPTEAEGQRGLRARVYLVQSRLPRNLSERRLLGFARRHNAKRMREITDKPIAEREWRAQMVTSFNRPPGDLEFHALFYDIENGAPRFVEDMSTFINDRSQKTFVQKLRLKRGRTRHVGFQPNRRMEMVVTVRRQEVARHRFELVGELIRRSGRVDFSESEAR